MKIDTSDVKKGTILLIENKLYRVNDMSHTHMARGGATYTFKMKDIVAGKSNQFTYNSGTMLEQADVETNNATFLYKGQDTYSFMENDTGEIYDIGEDVVEDVALYLKDNLDCYIMKFEGNVINVILPGMIQYTIESTVAGLKGDRSTAGKKPATLDNGMEVQVPLHKEAGQTVMVNTSTGEAG